MEKINSVRCGELRGSLRVAIVRYHNAVTCLLVSPRCRNFLDGLVSDRAAIQLALKNYPYTTFLSHDVRALIPGLHGNPCVPADSLQFFCTKCLEIRWGHVNGESSEAVVRSDCRLNVRLN
jgi:hypothetical protein